jgi:hypothetical protein
VTVKQTYLSALPLDSLLRIEHRRALALLCGGVSGRFCGARLRCILRSSEPMNSGAPRKHQTETPGISRDFESCLSSRVPIVGVVANLVVPGARAAGG